MRLSAVKGHEGDFAADGIAARIGLGKAGIATEAFEALDRGETTTALDALLDPICRGRRETPASNSAAPSSASSASSTPATPPQSATAAA